MLLLVDGSNIMFRSFFGVRPFVTKDGLHTNAVYGTITTLAKELDELRPDAVAVAFDLPEPTFRHKSYANYKGTRQKMPPELAEQIEYVRRAAEALGCRVVDLAGYEADDIIGTLARIGEEADHDVRILTGDRDSLQLITDKTKLLFITKGKTELYGRDEFARDYGTTPPRLVDIKALMGDSSDNIPGVPGVGEKTALRLISEAGSLDALYDNINTISVTDKLREKLVAGRDSAYMSYDLATIRRDAPVKETLSDLAYSGICREKLAALCAELEFHSLAARFAITDEEARPESAPAPVPEAEPLPEGAAPEDFLPEAAVTASDGVLYIMKTGDRRVFTTPADGEFSRRLLGSVPVVCHDVKSTAAHLPAFPEKYFDTMLAAYVLRPGDTGAAAYSLGRTALSYMARVVDDGELSPEARTVLTSELADALRRALDDADADARAYGEPPVSDVLYKIELPTARVLFDMERAGFAIDAAGILAYADTLAKEEDRIMERVFFEAGRRFNLNSPKQLGEVLFVDLGLPAGKKNRRGYSTDAETLEALRDRYAIVDDVLSYRQIAKLRSTYGETLASAAGPDGRIHTSFNQAVTATGRLSSTEPNLQNIPVRTELGRELRRFFVACDDEHVLVDADYSQIELRILASVSGDEVMTEAFRRGADIHTSTAAEVFGVPEESVTRELRSRAKAVNFGIVYGIGEYSLSRDIGTTRRQAGEYIEKYLSTYRGVDAYLKGSVERARERGFVTTLFGRRRYIPEASAQNKVTRAFGERVAMNSPIQGSAADVIKLAMIRAADALRASGTDARLIMQVHDELIVECRREDAERVSELLRSAMEGVTEPGGSSFPAPLQVDVKCGSSWYECK